MYCFLFFAFFYPGHPDNPSHTVTQTTKISISTSSAILGLSTQKPTTSMPSRTSGNNVAMAFCPQLCNNRPRCSCPLCCFISLYWDIFFHLIFPFSPSCRLLRCSCRRHQRTMVVWSLFGRRLCSCKTVYVQILAKLSCLVSKW